MHRAKRSAGSTARTTLTLTLPAQLRAAVDRALRRGRARSRNELVARALRHELGRERRRGIDAAFAEMARDPGAYAETLRVAREPSRHRALVIVLDLAGAR